ncbi:E1A [Egyptian fruit bat adenovirus]|uniref:E1A n=1 Tax=Egyptian fruit bat adenovirus TaxID=2849732 RepID=A0A344X9T8_9ADEN|nr:E1A [Rousettus aegyptiacus adenovirus]AXE75620.1 E1A [Egyptian fruit bat adenovirus]
MRHFSLTCLDPIYSVADDFLASLHSFSEEPDLSFYSDSAAPSTSHSLPDLVDLDLAPFVPLDNYVDFGYESDEDFGLQTVPNLPPSVLLFCDAPASFPDRTEIDLHCYESMPSSVESTGAISPPPSAQVSSSPSDCDQHICDPGNSPCSLCFLRLAYSGMCFSYTFSHLLC